jgi:hypothetical protein
MNEAEYLTIRGPALKGVYIMGLAVNFARRSGSSHRSGSNSSASEPHKAGFRWVSNGKYMMVVFLGMYNGCEDDGELG